MLQRCRPLQLITVFGVSLCFIFLAEAVYRPVTSQSLTGYERQRGQAMLRMVKEDLKRHYYDPNFRGMDVEARFKEAEEKIKQAVSNGQVFGIIAQVLLELNDSHTFFVPPSRTNETDYGWWMQMFGDRCYVAAVKPGSDAEKKGLKPGDEILSVDGREPRRENLWILDYLYHQLRPQPGMRLVVVDPSGAKRDLVVAAKIKTGKQITDLTSGADIMKLIRDAENEARFMRQRYVETDDLLIWKMPEFDLERSNVDSLIDKARKRNNLILDLRGNSGGREDTMLRLIGNFFDRDINVGELKRRKESKSLVAKKRGSDFFSGNLVVLVDSKSGSASELFSRVVQLEKRGTVLGDRSAGAVMRSRGHSHQAGMDIVSFYAVSITDADIIMTDGKSLEHVGVIPDRIILPTAADLRDGRDPVLAEAAALLGFKLDAQKAGSFFPIEWRK